jgi:large conductance mechanosensitive channel
MAFVDDFRKFAFKGNVVDLAVGVVIGGAFGKIVSALVADVIMPVVSLALPGGDWRNRGLVLRAGATPKDDVIVKWGDFLGACLDFFIIALALFLLVSKFVAALSKKPEETPKTRECPYCLETVPIAAQRCRACTSALEKAAS